jgi:hypothetical protein
MVVFHTSKHVCQQTMNYPAASGLLSHRIENGIHTQITLQNQNEQPSTTTDTQIIGTCTLTIMEIQSMVDLLVQCILLSQLLLTQLFLPLLIHPLTLLTTRTISPPLVLFQLQAAKRTEIAHVILDYRVF